MPDLTQTLSKAGMDLPNFQFSGMGDLLLYIVAGLLVAICIGIGAYFIFQEMKFNKKIVLFKKISGKIIPVARFKGMFERLGKAGDYWIKTRGLKKILPRPKLEISKNVYWYFEREDGEWINFDLEDIDERFRKAKIKYLDEDMRLQRIGIQRNLKERYDQATFWQKYGGMIMSAMFILIITICLVIIFNKINDLVKALPVLARALESVANAMKDTAVSQGSGIVPAGGG